MSVMIRTSRKAISQNMENRVHRKERRKGDEDDGRRAMEGAGAYVQRMVLRDGMAVEGKIRENERGTEGRSSEGEGHIMKKK